MTANYFDEAYFERGWERGTAYSNYSRHAITNPTSKEVARAIKEVFRPKTCLEIGCATGAIVRHLNDLGVSAYGIDVSEWAIENRLHENVILAGANDLPFAADSFDLVISSHAMEHIPRDLLNDSLDEIDRVLMPEGYQFHMLPLIGTYPYDYEPELAIRDLSDDPTHHILESMPWWLEHWAKLGWKKLGLTLNLANDAGMAELSGCQFTLFKGAYDAELFPRAFEWNGKAHRELFLQRRLMRERQHKVTPIAGSLDAFCGHAPSNEMAWQETGGELAQPISFEQGVISMIIELISDKPVNLRAALIDTSDATEKGVLEFWIEAQPGVFTIYAEASEFALLSGNPDLSKISTFYVGGALEGGSLKVAASLFPLYGSAIPLI